MAIIARQTITWRSAGGVPILLCHAGADVLEAEIGLEGHPTIQRDRIIGRPWAAQRALGNATLSLSMTVSRVYPSAAQAEAAGEDIRLALLTQGVGTLTIASCYDAGVPLRVVDYTAGVDSAAPLSAVSDRWFGQGFGPASPSDKAVQELVERAAGQAWGTIQYEFTLTDPLRR